jgi:hypothetical protein
MKTIKFLLISGIVSFIMIMIASFGDASFGEWLFTWLTFVGIMKVLTMGSRPIEMS